MEQETTIQLTKQYVELLTETFESVHGYYLDRNTSLFETLETINAATASRAVSPTCPTLAGQIVHVEFYLDAVLRMMQGEKLGKIDWSQSWLVHDVDEPGWRTVLDKLRRTYGALRAFLEATQDWAADDRLADALAVVAHTAYHLGGLRQALCVLA